MRKSYHFFSPVPLSAFYLFPDSPASSLLFSPECGLEHREHLPFPRTTIPEPTEGAPPDMSTSAQMYLPPTQQSTQQFKLPSGTLPLDKELTHLKETTTFKSIVDYSLGIGFKDGENQKLEKEIEGTATEKSAVVAVLSLLAIVFILTGVLLSVLCKRRRDQSLQCSPGKLGL